MRQADGDNAVERKHNFGPAGGGDQSVERTGQQGLRARTGRTIRRVDNEGIHAMGQLRKYDTSQKKVGENDVTDEKFGSLTSPVLQVNDNQ